MFKWHITLKEILHITSYNKKISGVFRIMIFRRLRNRKLRLRYNSSTLGVCRYRCKHSQHIGFVNYFLNYLNFFLLRTDIYRQTRVLYHLLLWVQNTYKYNHDNKTNIQISLFFVLPIYEMWGTLLYLQNNKMRCHRIST